MLNTKALINGLRSGAYDEKLGWLYCCPKEEAAPWAKRYIEALEGLEKQFGTKEEAALFSAPGRTEIGGNHTDHQHGHVLAGSVNMDMVAAAAPNELGLLRMMSQGYEPFEIDLADLEKKPSEENSSAAILRGSCAAYKERGAQLSGLDIYVISNVPKGSGVSSSAAFEVLTGTILNELFMPADKKQDPVQIAQIGQWVENVYFGKPCGLMDQMASSVGGVVGIDFADPSRPVVEQVDFDLESAGLSLCLIDSGADHADLTDEYAAVPAECKGIAQLCGADVLREAGYELFLEKLPQLREQLGDRAVLRAFHFYADDRRAVEELEALKAKNFELFLAIIDQSGHSSWEYLQNISPAGAVEQQAVAVTIALAKELLGGRGAVRVHGGGFAGTVQAFVPLELVDSFLAGMDRVLGSGSSHRMSIRPVGGFRLA